MYKKWTSLLTLGHWPTDKNLRKAAWHDYATSREIINLLRNLNWWTGRQLSQLSWKYTWTHSTHAVFNLVIFHLSNGRELRQSKSITWWKEIYQLYTTNKRRLEESQRKRVIEKTKQNLQGDEHTSQIMHKKHSNKLIIQGDYQLLQSA